MTAGMNAWTEYVPEGDVAQEQLQLGSVERLISDWHDLHPKGLACAAIVPPKGSPFVPINVKAFRLIDLQKDTDPARGDPEPSATVYAVSPPRIFPVSMKGFGVSRVGRSIGSQRHVIQNCPQFDLAE